MFRNFKIVPNIIFGRGCFNQLDEILAARRSASTAPMVFVVDDVFENHVLRDRIPAKDQDMLLWVNVDDEPKTSYVDTLCDQVKKRYADPVEPSARGGHRYRRRKRHGFGQGRFAHDRQPRIRCRLSGMGLDQKSRGLPCRSADPFRYRGRSLPHHRLDRTAKEIGNQFRLYSIRPDRSRPGTHRRLCRPSSASIPAWTATFTVWNR